MKTTEDGRSGGAMRIEEDATVDGRLAVKHFNVPGFAIHGACPACGAPYLTDFSTRHIEYPVVNEPFDFTCYCQHCEHEWAIIIRINLAIEIVK
jgi:hypothetical protein